jgi:hypothetical protein
VGASERRLGGASERQAPGRLGASENTQPASAPWDESSPFPRPES